MNEPKRNKFGAMAIDKGTVSYAEFVTELERTEFLLLFIQISGNYISENKEKARKLIIDIYDDKNNEISVQTIDFFKTEKADKYFTPEFYEDHFSQTFFARSIDNLTTYFKDILAEVVIKKPQILKSKDQEKLDFILSYDNMEDLIKAVSEKKIEELFYKGIDDIEKFFNDRLGIKIFKDNETKKYINFLIKKRNLVVHNRGRISKEFFKEFPKKGHTYSTDVSFKFGYRKDISAINVRLTNFITELDIEIAKKFDLDLVEIRKSVLQNSASNQKK